MTKHDTHSLPTLRQLAKATCIALTAAGAILVGAVLPAEFGIDPTGLGSRLGLTAMKPADAEAASVIPASASAPVESAGAPMPAPSVIVSKSDVPFRGDELSLTLQPSEGAEIKATMRQGEQFVFHWATEGGPVNFDMHGERPDAGDRFTSYRKGSQQTVDQGTFAAPFDGTHGWFWRNRGDKPVTVKVKVNGFYEKIARMK